MANPTIRGHQATFKFYQDGEEVVIDSIVRVSIAQESSMTRQFFVGRAVPEGDQSFDGWSGSIDMQVRNAVEETFIDGLVTANLAGVGVSDYSFVTTERYSDGTSRSYVYFDCQFKMSKDQGGLQEKVTKRIDFQAAARVAL